MMLDRLFTLTSIVVGLVSVWTAKAAIFVKYEGVKGESKDGKHEDWIDVLSIDWNCSRPTGSATGQARRRRPPIVEDITLKMEYDKATPKLQEKCLKGEIIPKLEIEQTRTYSDSSTGETKRVPYMKYELEKVLITSYSVSHSSGEGAQPKDEVEMSNKFEKVRLTYFERDEKGNQVGDEHEIEYDIAAGV